MTHRIVRPLLAILLFGSAAAAEAGEVSFRNVTGVGPWIAEQGNQALRDLAREFKENIAEQLKLIAPQAPEAAPQAEMPPVASATTLARS